MVGSKVESEHWALLVIPIGYLDYVELVTVVVVEALDVEFD